LVFWEEYGYTSMRFFNISSKVPILAHPWSICSSYLKNSQNQIQIVKPKNWLLSLHCHVLWIVSIHVAIEIVKKSQLLLVGQLFSMEIGWMTNFKGLFIESFVSQIVWDLDCRRIFRFLIELIEVWNFYFQSCVIFGFCNTHFSLFRFPHV